nr:unnamed protein product [Callosobruchus chinensis]
MASYTCYNKGLKCKNIKSGTMPFYSASDVGSLDTRKTTVGTNSNQKKWNKSINLVVPLKNVLTVARLDTALVTLAVKTSSLKLRKPAYVKKASTGIKLTKSRI